MYMYGMLLLSLSQGTCGKHYANTQHDQDGVSQPLELIML